MTPWAWVARHGAGAQRLEDWRRLLQETFSAWEPFLDAVEDPSGIRFWADFGGGEAEHELAQGRSGHVAVPLDGGAGVPLNPTQAEFRRLQLTAVFMAMQKASRLRSPPVPLPGSAFAHRIGAKLLDRRGVAVFAVPRGGDLFDPVLRHQFSVAYNGVDAGVVLVPDPSVLAPHAVADLRERRLVAAALPTGPPWSADFRPLADAPEFGFSVRDPVEFFGRSVVLVVHKGQRQIWIEEQKLNVHAGSRPYLLLEHLAEKPGIPVPHDVLANRVLSGAAGGTEGKVVNDAKRDLTKAVQKCIADVHDARVNAKDLIRNGKGTEALNLPPELVRVLR